MNTHASEVCDLDHVVMADGRIYRVVGNLDHPAKFVGYNVYSPHSGGDRIFRGKPYRKNFTEDDELPQDALDTYVMLPKARICEHLDPYTAAAEKAGTFAGSEWAGLHAELTTLFGPDAVGIFGSAMLGMHLTPNGQVRKDIDFVISRRWTALQAPNGIVTTIRFRDPAVRLPYQLAGAYPVQAKDITITGKVADADQGNLFPRVFRLLTGSHAYTVHLWWWKFASPVRDGETVTICGSRRDLPGQDVIRISSFTRHWLQVHHP
jgi:hypothetical protein